MKIEYDNIFPHDEQIERSVLASLLSSTEQHHLYIPVILPEFFYNLNNREIFAKIKECFGKGKNVDLITISSVLPSQAVYLTEIYIHNVGIHLGEYVQILTDLYSKRTIIENCLTIIQQSQENVDTAIETLGSLEKKIADVYSQFNRPATIGELLSKSLDLAILRTKENKSGIPCPIAELRLLLGGWQRTDLIIIAARPSMGKTAFALHSAKYAAKLGYNVLFFSVEMDAIKLTDRMITQEADIKPDKYRDGELDDEMIKAAEQAYYRMRTLPVSIVDKADIGVDQIRSMSNAIKPDLIIVDYLQILSMKESKNFSMVQEIGKITRKLKIIARELNVPVIVLSQLNRGLESRADKKPMLSDLRESGNIEQDADVVLFLYRDFVYSQENEGEIEAIVGKHRNGKANISVKFKHNKYVNDFFDYETEKPF